MGRFLHSTVNSLFARLEPTHECNDINLSILICHNTPFSYISGRHISSCPILLITNSQHSQFLQIYCNTHFLEYYRQYRILYLPAPSSGLDFCFSPIWPPFLLGLSGPPKHFDHYILLCACVSLFHTMALSLWASV